MTDLQTVALTWVSTPRALQEMLLTIKDSPYLAVDTESNSLYVYQEQVCLIQISTAFTDYLIDPLALADLSALAPLFANPRQEKIFHAAEYDIICLKRDYGFKFTNLFDTMVAARILGEPAVGLGSLIQSRLDITLEKKYQRANWGIRPLSEPMLEYARLDSHYLYQLKVILEKELRERGLRNLALEDFRLGCEVEGHSQNSALNCWKVAGAAEITSAEAAILQELCNYREGQAQHQNVPPFKVLSNELLVTLAKEQPSQLADLVGYRGLTPRLIERYGTQILEAIQRGRQLPPLLRPSRPRPDERFLRRFDALKEWRKIKGQEMKVESDVILPRDFLERIAIENPKTLPDLHTLMAQIPWRYQHLHKEIFSVLRKQEVA